MNYFMLSTLISKALFSFQFIKDLHSWPLTSAHGLTWTEASWDFLQALTANHLNGFSALFSMSVSVDDKNSSRYIIAVSKITKNLFIKFGWFSTARPQPYTKADIKSKPQVCIGFTEVLLYLSCKLAYLIGWHAVKLSKVCLNEQTVHLTFGSSATMYMTKVSKGFAFGLCRIYPSRHYSPPCRQRKGTLGLVNVCFL